MATLSSDASYDYPGNFEQRKTGAELRHYFVEQIKDSAYPKDSTISFMRDDDETGTPNVYFELLNEVNPAFGYITPDGKVTWL